MPCDRSQCNRLLWPILCSGATWRLWMGLGKVLYCGVVCPLFPLPNRSLPCVSSCSCSCSCSLLFTLYSCAYVSSCSCSCSSAASLPDQIHTSCGCCETQTLSLTHPNPSPRTRYLAITNLPQPVSSNQVPGAYSITNLPPTLLLEPGTWCLLYH
jgi:hypothetical protein